MKQKSYQNAGTVGTVLAVVLTVVMAALKLCGLLTFSWWLVMLPFIVVVLFWAAACCYVVWFFSQISKGNF